MSELLTAKIQNQRSRNSKKVLQKWCFMENTNREKPTDDISPEIFRAFIIPMRLGVFIDRLEDLNDVRSFRIIFVNPAASKFAGADVSRFVGRTLPEAFPPFMDTEYPERMRQVVLTKVPDSWEIEYSDKNIKQGWFRVDVFPLPDNCLGFTTENITVQRQAEQKFSEHVEAVERMNKYMLSHGKLVADLQREVDELKEKLERAGS